ncbi:hypothetical protein SESBI_10901 [Sesbania bispinosa]|nr:hypothetical protein SESBI_10901 [Sesbania bispinosa]
MRHKGTGSACKDRQWPWVDEDDLGSKAYDANSEQGSTLCKIRRRGGGILSLMKEWCD